MSATKIRKRIFPRNARCGTRPIVFVAVILTLIVVVYFMFVLHFFSSQSSSSTATSDKSETSTVSPLLSRVRSSVSSSSPSTSSSSSSSSSAAAFPDFDPEDDNLHLVFNTGCNLFQHWQAQALMASAAQVNQRGWITRIVSGCDYNDTSGSKTIWTHPPGLSDRMVPLEELKRSVFPRFRLHLTPVFEGAKEYPYLNKPQSLEHWVKHATPKITQNIVAILDPDFIFVTPLTVSGEGDVLFSGRKSAGQHKVSKGHPVAQQYGIGGQWVKLAKQVCGEDSPCTKVTPQEAEKFYQVGAPYLLHKDDFTQLMPLYTTFMKAYVAIKGAGILSDMYAYAMAAAHLELPHTIFDHFMVSCVDCGGEGWPWVDVETHDACKNPFELPAHSPVVLHYCHNYNNGNFDDPMFHKGHVPPNILDCDQPSIIEAYANYQSTQTTRHNKRNAWMVCMVLPRLNLALEQYKKAFCKTPDLTKRFRLIHGEQSHSCGGKEGETCWVYADKKEENWQWSNEMAYVGCFADKPNERDFPNSMPGKTMRECWAQAKKENAKFFALQAGDICYWGDSYGMHGKADHCGMRCRQPPGLCGGKNANAVYVV